MADHAGQRPQVLLGLGKEVEQFELGQGEGLEQGRIAVGVGAIEGQGPSLGQQQIEDDRLRQPNGSRIDTEQNRSTLDGLTAQAWTPVTDSLRLRYGVELYIDAVDSSAYRESPPGSGTMQRTPMAGGAATARGESRDQGYAGSDEPAQPHFPIAHVQRQSLLDGTTDYLEVVPLDTLERTMGDVTSSIAKVAAAPANPMAPMPSPPPPVIARPRRRHP